MPTTFHWIAADRAGRLARIQAERHGVVPRRAILLDTEPGDALLEALRVAWLREVAPRLAIEQHDLEAIPESTAPHLVVFSRAVSLEGANLVPSAGDALDGAMRIVYFERPTEALRTLLLAEEESDDPAIVGSLDVGRGAFGEHHASILYQYSNWDRSPHCYGKRGVPQFSLGRASLGSVAGSVVELDADFAAQDEIDLAELLAPNERYEL